MKIAAFMEMKNPTSPNIIVILAEQGIKVVRAAVINLSRSDLSIRVAKIPGTVHPYPRIKGITERPCNPILCMKLSIK